MNAHGDETAEAAARILRRRVESGSLWLTVEGRSMQPTLPSEAQVRVVAAQRPRPGQVWAFVDETGALVVHRYLRRRPGGWLVFRGDAVGYDDPSVRPDQLVGRVDAARDGTGSRSVRTRYRPVVRSVVGAARRRLVAVAGRIRSAARPR